jgi:tetratricopeptide (TPR) repeat protein
MIDNLILTKFKKASQQLEKGNVIAFGKSLIDIYDNLTCNCFFRDQKEVDYQKQLEYISLYKGDDNNFYVNLAKGFIYLRIEDEIKAYTYLTNAINLNSSCDVPYSLRATIKADINQINLKDAIKAVHLNPSVRNFFVLGNVYSTESDENSIKKSILCYSKVIKLQPELACAYSNKAVQLDKSKDMLGAVNDWIKCVEIDKNHWSYFNIWVILNKLGINDEALKYIELGAKIHPDKISYQLALGLANSKMGNYDTAIFHLKEYLKVNPQHSDSIKLIEYCEKFMPMKVLHKAYNAFKECNYNQAIAFFEEYYTSESNTIFNGLNIYLISLLKTNTLISLDNSNPVHQKLYILKKSFSEKVKTGTILTDKEKNQLNY